MKTYEIRKFSVYTPTAGQKGVNKEPNSFTIKEFGFNVEVGGVWI